MQHLHAHLFLVAASACLSGCAALQAVGAVPDAEFSVTYLSRPTPAAVLGCVKSSILALSPERQTQIADGITFKSRQGFWATDVTAWNIEEGLLETGNYPQSNLQGLRVRAVYTSNTARLHLQIKAAGPYGSDLGAQAHGGELLMRVARCLEASGSA